MSHDGGRPTVRDFQPDQPSRAATSPIASPQGRERARTGRTHGASETRRPFPTLQVDGLQPPGEELLSPVRSSRGLRRRVSSGSSMSIQQRVARSNTVKAYHVPLQPGWEPGAEPGVDTSKEHDEDEHRLRARCAITVFDYADEQMVRHHLDNDTLPEFLARPKEDWVACRWICVNGLSYDVIKALANYKKLHSLAIEDLMNPRSRTKVDWYSDHCFILMTLAKLIRLAEHTDHKNKNKDKNRVGESGSLDEIDRAAEDKMNKLSLTSVLRKIVPKTSDNDSIDLEVKEHYLSDQNGADENQEDEMPEMDPEHPFGTIRTLQRFRGGLNHDRIEYMERKSPLTARDLAVSIEQVSMFLTADNEVISFFEHSADDILGPIAERLESPETILRRSCDASMLTQALIDAIIDLALPVAQAYDDVIAELELDVLVDPDIKQPKLLYILTSELTTLRSNITPVAAVLKALRDHRQDPIANPSGPSRTASSSGPGGLPTMSTVMGMHANMAHTHTGAPLGSAISAGTSTSVTISPLTHTYLGDVEDHVHTLGTHFDTLRGSAENLTSLIFQMMSAYQNESLKQLTLITIIFTPLTFLVGYFGQNFSSFWAVNNNSDAFFWYIATPVTAITVIFLMRDMMAREIERWIGRTKMRKRREDRNKRFMLARQQQLRRAAMSKQTSST